MSIETPKIIRRNCHYDKRGYLQEIYLGKKNFKFSIITSSKKNVFRGFHFQTKNIQAKYVNVIKGKILYIVIDLRKKSKTFGKTYSIILYQKNALGLFIPPGFAHAYFSYDKENIIYYKLDNYYNPKFENGIIFKDPTLKLKLSNKVIVSKKDKQLMTLDQFKKKFKYL